MPPASRTSGSATRWTRRANNSVAEGATPPTPPSRRPSAWSNQTQIARKTFSVGHAGARAQGRLKVGDPHQTVPQGQGPAQGHGAEPDREPDAHDRRHAPGPRSARLAAVQQQFASAASHRWPLAATRPRPTARCAPFAESHLRDGVRLAYLSGGNPTTLMLHPTISRTPGRLHRRRHALCADRRQEASRAPSTSTSTTSGTVEVVPNRVMRAAPARATWSTPTWWRWPCCATWRPPSWLRIGSARNYMVVETEYTLECREERAHAPA